MGLDAWVRCNCIKDGISAPHPFPELLCFDETGEPTLDASKEQPSLEQWLEHDKWQRTACPHGDRLLEKRLGNIALIWHIREFTDAMPEDDLRMIRERVVYADSHSGDWISAYDSYRLRQEATDLRSRATDSLIAQFASDLIELAEASAATGNPIMF